MTISIDQHFARSTLRRHVPSLATARGAWFVAVCMVVIATSLGVVLYTQLRLSVGEAGWAAFACLVTMVLAELYTARSRERNRFERELREISAGTSELSREVGQLSHKLDNSETLVSRRVRETVDARLGVLLDDMSSIETLLRELSGEVRDLKEVRVQEPPPPAPEPVARAAVAVPAQPSPEAIAQPDPAVAKAIVHALRNEQVDVYLQATVALPQRKATHYEALTRLRGDRGDSLLPAQYLPEARRVGLMPRLDAAVLQKALRIAEQMARRERGALVFCNIDAATLSGNAAILLLETLERGSDHAGSIVIEMPADVFAGLGSVEHETIEAVAELGCRFCVDNVSRLTVDGSRLSQRHVRFMKVDAAVLLDPGVEVGDIHPSDFARLMARSGIEVIATRVESESQVLDLLDHDIGLAQGYLFGRPRPVRLGGMVPQLAAV